MSNTEAIVALLAGVCSLLGYIAVVVRWIAKRSRAWERLLQEHAMVMDAAHWHEQGEVIPLTHRHRGGGHRRPAERWP